MATSTGPQPCPFDGKLDAQKRPVETTWPTVKQPRKVDLSDVVDPKTRTPRPV